MNEAAIKGAKFMQSLLEMTLESKARSPEPSVEEIAKHFMMLWDAEPKTRIYLILLSQVAGHVDTMLQLVEMCKLAGMDRDDAVKHISEMQLQANANQN